MPSFVIGPCAMEFYWSVAESLDGLLQGQSWFYKASFDKANRTSVSGERGPGLEQAKEWFEQIRQDIPGIRLTTDVHEVSQVKALAELVDCIQIPAFLCRQTDLLVEAGAHFPIVNVKKGQWINPAQAREFVGKVRAKNAQAEVWLTERGTFFGYDRLVVDFSTATEFSEIFDHVFLDCTHSTQRAKGAFTGGNRELAKHYFLAAPIFGYDGVFAEVHPNPDKAISDADSQIDLADLSTLLERHCQIQDLSS